MNKINNKLKLDYNDIEKLNDYDFILVSTRFLEFTKTYYSVIDKNPDILKLITPILNSYSNETANPLYIRLSVLRIKNIYKNFPKDRFWKSTFKKNIIVNISLKDAYDLLTKDIINKEKDLYLPKNRWILHSLYVSEASKRIAFLLGLNDNKATILGLLHDIGRRINHNTHEIDGYKFLNNLGFYSEAKVCITHSFLDNDINLTLKDINKKTYNFINFFLQNNKVTIYDNIIQLCDLFCLETGFTTIEKRLLDIFKHIDIDSNDNYEKYFEKIIELKEKIENMMQCSLYDLFPEIKKEDLINKQNDYNELINLFNSKKLKNNML